MPGCGREKNKRKSRNSFYYGGKQMGIRLKRIMTLVLTITVFVVGLTGCSKNEEAASRPVLKVGVILPLTGDSSYIGASIKSGMEIAVAEFNNAADKPGFDLNVEYVDSGGVTAKVVSAYQSLVSIKDVQAIIPVQQGVKALIPLVERDKRLLLATSVPDNGIAGQNSWTFRFFINAETDASSIAAYAYNKLGIRKVATIYVNDDMGMSYRESFARHFGDLGGSVVREVDFSPSSADYRTLVLKIKEVAPDAVYLIGYGKSMSNIPIQLREAGVEATLLSVGTISQPEIMKAAGESVEGCYYTTSKFFTFAPDTPELKRFVDLYKQNNGKVPVFFEVFGYDALNMVIAAARRGGVEPQKLRDAFAGLKDLPMAVGDVSVGSDGDVRFPVVVKRIVDGQWAPAP